MTDAFVPVTQPGYSSPAPTPDPATPAPTPDPATPAPTPDPATPVAQPLDYFRVGHVVHYSFFDPMHRAGPRQVTVFGTIVETVDVESTDAAGVPHSTPCARVAWLREVSDPLPLDQLAH